MSGREIVSIEKLNQWLTDKVSSHEDCEGAEVTGVYKLTSPDSDGCNWSSGSIIFETGLNADHSTLSILVKNAAREARAKFNLE